MPLDVPHLDDRHFQDIVNELTKRIPRYCPEWTDHNVSDPGVTLIELFSFVTEQLLYRLNQVPRLHYIRMMELLGIRLEGPQAAEVPVTFWFAAPFSNAETIQAGTQVSTTQTENKAPVVFATKNDFVVREPQLQAVYTGFINDSTTSGDANASNINYHSQPRLAAKEWDASGVEAFSSAPRDGDALYFGFENDLSGYVLRFQMEVDNNATDGIQPHNPPWKWEASTGLEDAPWAQCEIEKAHNTMGGMSRNGTVQLVLPPMGKNTLESENLKSDTLYWIRVCVDHSMPIENTGRYKKPPKIHRLAAIEAYGCTIQTIHSEVIEHELLGVSDGLPGQHFALESFPILPRTATEKLLVYFEDRLWGDWQEVHHFGDSSATDHHYTLDSMTGELRLGPAIQQRTGEICQYGAVPPSGARLVMQQYRYGGGVVGNVKANEINILKTSIPYVSIVRNRINAVGGLDGQSLDDAMLRAPQMLRARNRAVTAEDFEYIVTEKCGHLVGRVKCLPPSLVDHTADTNGSAHTTRHAYIDLRVIPAAANPENPTIDELSPADTVFVPLQIRLQQVLDQYRLLTTRISITLPTYVWVTVTVQINRTPGLANDVLEEFILRRLYRFLNPLVGGPHGEGWPFGHSLHKSEIHQCLIGPIWPAEAASNELHRASLEQIIRYADITLEHGGRTTNDINLGPDNVIASTAHKVIFR